MNPRMWSLSNDYSIPQLKYMTFSQKTERRMSNYKVEEGSMKKPENSEFIVKNKKQKDSNASFTVMENIQETEPSANSITKE